MQGTYFFADYCTSKIWSLRYDGSNVSDYQDRTSELDPSGSTSITSIVGFGEDAAGEIYICELNGEIFKIVPVAVSGACCIGDSGSCVSISESNCDAGGGNWLGANTSCNDGGCEVNNCPEDINGDGNVSTTDLLAIIAAWGPCSGCGADINGDGNVSTTDLLAIIAAWGACP